MNFVRHFESCIHYLKVSNDDTFMNANQYTSNIAISGDDVAVAHFTQTAVDGREIDNTVHMLRDFIQLANNENLESAFIFLDRVDHEFLYKTMKAFGIGAAFDNGFARSIPMRPHGSK